MFSRAFHILRTRPAQALAAISSDPFEAWTAFRERRIASREPPPPADLYQPLIAWEHQLHDLLGFPWPCPAAFEFWAVWQRVIEELKDKGVRVGPESFKNWNDGDPGLVRAIWCLIHHLRPENIVETGVAHGVTSRFILEALAALRRGHLWSIDHPPIEREWQRQIGIAVSNRYQDRWSYIRGSSKRRLPGLLSQLGTIDLFIHDSLHSTHNVQFELKQAWATLRKGGVIVVDDIDVNHAFFKFTQANNAHKSLICEAEPTRPDLRRFNNKGLFGIVIK
jgi:Methyltransferase domain